MEKVCVIGAGASGIAAAKVLHERNVPFDVYEMSSGIGGVWRYKNDNGLSAAYRSLHINTSKQRMNYSDFPFPDDYPTYPHHSEILAYFENYVDHFGFRDKIKFQTCVQHIEPLENGGYNVTLQSGETISYSNVIVCNGHHWDMRMPEPPFAGEFDGEEIHSNDYKVPEPYIDKSVLVVGIGNSGIDIAVDVSRVAKNTYLSTRSGAHILPKYLLGRPLDHWTTPLTTSLPPWLQSILLNILRLLTIGRQQAYGVPTPDRPMFAQHPSVSSDLLHYVGHGKVKIKPDIDYKDIHDVVFKDGSRLAVDSIIYATGYNISFPFLDDVVMNPENNEISLFQLTVHPDYKGLYFVGLCQPLGAIMPISERQSIWIADLIEGKSALPLKADMMQEIEERREAIYKRYDNRPRHTIQVDFFPFMSDLQREMNRGKKRL